MFTNYEKKLLGGDYFTIIREEEKFIELKSKNTGHCWLIFKQTYNKDRPVVLYHKHTADTKWYHEHWNSHQCRVPGRSDSYYQIRHDMVEGKIIINVSTGGS